MVLKQYGFDFDTNRCVQCHACETACKSTNNVELGLKWRRVIDQWGGEFPNVKNRTISFACLHCGEPLCLHSCPTGAIYKRAEDGIVLVDKDKCIGCRCCLQACPFGIPQFASDGKMQKCNLCADRLDSGASPVCVETCPAEALYFGPLDALSGEKTGRVSKKLFSLAYAQ